MVLAVSCPCPSDLEEIAEEYCLGHLDRESAQYFENHFLHCPACAREVVETQQFVRIFRLAECA